MIALWWDKLTNRWALLVDGVVRQATVVTTDRLPLRSRTRVGDAAPHDSVPMAWFEFDGVVEFVGEVATVTERRT